jgi:hypothetical protein
MPQKRICKYPPPSRVWEQTESGRWASRDWRPGKSAWGRKLELSEKEIYAKEVLGQEPMHEVTIIEANS